MVTQTVDDVVVGTTKKFQLTAKKDGVAWDLTNATVTLFLLSPLGTETEHAATVDDAEGGIASFTNTVGFFTSNNKGDWSRAWKIVDGAVVEKSERIEFSVLASP